MVIFSGSRRSLTLNEPLGFRCSISTRSGRTPEIGSQPGGQPKTAGTLALQCNRRVIEDRLFPGKEIVSAGGPVYLHRPVTECSTCRVAAHRNPGICAREISLLRPTLKSGQIDSLAAAVNERPPSRRAAGSRRRLRQLSGRASSPWRSQLLTWYADVSEWRHRVSRS